jgi:hypothetical protein
MNRRNFMKACCAEAIVVPAVPAVCKNVDTKPKADAYVPSSEHPFHCTSGALNAVRAAIRNAKTPTGGPAEVYITPALWRRIMAGGWDNLTAIKDVLVVDGDTLSQRYQLGKYGYIEFGVVVIYYGWQYSFELKRDLVYLDGEEFWTVQLTHRFRV